MPSSRKSRWLKRVTEGSNALDLESGVFTLDDPRAIAESLKRSAERSWRRKTTPFQSAMSMLTFYINRAGRSLPQDRRAPACAGRETNTSANERHDVSAKPRTHARRCLPAAVSIRLLVNLDVAEDLVEVQRVRLRPRVAVGASPHGTAHVVRVRAGALAVVDCLEREADADE